MINKTKISKRIRKKVNPELVETLKLAKKTNPELAALLSRPARKQIILNLDEISKRVKEKDKIIIIPGKVLGKGELNSSKKLKIIALSFSESAIEKIKKAGSEASILSEELNKGEIQGEILR